jgi:hypothetical protein
VKSAHHDGDWHAFCVLPSLSSIEHKLGRPMLSEGSKIAIPSANWMKDAISAAMVPYSKMC